MIKYDKEHTPLEAMCASDVVYCIVIIIGELFNVRTVHYQM
jgi:hypothetical protein